MRILAIISVARRSARRAVGAAGVMSSFVALGVVAGDSGPVTGGVVVHLMEPDVEVRVGGVTRRVGGEPGPPLVLDLPCGRYELLISRRGETLHREEFTVEGAQTVALIAWVARAP